MTNLQKIRSITRWLLFTGDILIPLAVYFFSFLLRSQTSLMFFQEKMPFNRFYWVTHHLGLLISVHILLIYFHGLYDPSYQASKNDLLSRVIRATSWEVLILVAVYFFRQDLAFPRSIFLLYWIFTIIATHLWHSIWLKYYLGKLPDRNLLIVGTNDATRNLLKEIERLPTYRLNVFGVLTESSVMEDSSFCGYPILGTRDDLLEIVQKYDIQEVVISSEESWQDKLVHGISRMEEVSSRICVIPSCYEILIGKINHLRLYDIPLIEVIKHPQTYIGKRFVDFSAAMILFVLTLPLFLFTAVLIKLTSKGPVLFRQERIGKERKPFVIFKFRTLVEGAEDQTGPVLTDQNDQRITSIGKFLRKYRIDELPQLINIIKGEMSFVGPRPERSFFIAQYIDAIPGYGERFKAWPGLTGLAQVNGGYATTPQNKLKYDLAYIYNQSYWLDLRILLETIKVILTGRVQP